MATHDIICCSADASNVGGREGEISIRLPSPLPATGGVLVLKKLVVSRAQRGPFWVWADVGQPSVLSDGTFKEIIGVYHCDGNKNRTYVYPESDIRLPLRPGTLSSLTLRFANPLTHRPIAFQKGLPPLIVAHLQILPSLKETTFHKKR